MNPSMSTASSNHLDFAIIGAMKCGTTSLFDFLAAHPDVCAPRNKEPHYFTRGYRMPAAYYRHIFRHRLDGQICGEASPTYSWVQRYPRSPERIAADAPDVRLIFLIRDPLERVLSQLRHRRLVGTIDPDVETAVRYPELWERSSYKTTLTAYLEHFDRARLLVADLADLGARSTLLTVLDHLDLDPAPLEPLPLQNANASIDRVRVPGFIGRSASTSVGAVVRDVLPQALVNGLKKPFEHAAEARVRPGPTITNEDLRRHAPDECARVEAEYAAVRRDFLDRL